MGILAAGDEADPEELRRMGEFQQRLDELGWRQDRTVRIIRRWDVTDRVAKELVALKPDAIFAEGTPSVAALQRETRTPFLSYLETSAIR